MKEKKSDQFCSQCADKSRDILSRRSKLNWRIIENREKSIRSSEYSIHRSRLQAIFNDKCFCAFL